MGINNLDLLVTIEGSEIKLNRPLPVLSDVDVFPFNRHLDPLIATEALVDREYPQ